VDWLRNRNFPMPQPPIRFYPDGSLWTDDYTVLEWTYEEVIDGRKHRGVLAVEQLIHHNLPGAYACGLFRPLAPFGGDREDAANYSVLYPGSCTWMGENENGALTYPGICKDVTADEYDLACVRVLIKLRRKFTVAVAEELARVVRRWFAEIGSQGVFGEAGVRSISSGLRWMDRCAGFELDATGSGQETLNTLYLAVLNWAMNHKQPLVLTDLAADRSEPVSASNQSVLWA
jgi:hypothetical protein